tara:strand:- start:865 stop:1068 length:204 start_codon:yes stop_codon:yes gene_type:complete
VRRVPNAAHDNGDCRHDNDDDDSGDDRGDDRRGDDDGGSRDNDDERGWRRGPVCSVWVYDCVFVHGA